MNLPFLSSGKTDRSLTAFKYTALDESGKKVAGTEMARRWARCISH